MVVKIFQVLQLYRKEPFRGTVIRLMNSIAYSNFVLLNVDYSSQVKIGSGQSQPQKNCKKLFYCIFPLYHVLGVTY